MDDSAYRQLGEKLRRNTRGDFFLFIDEALKRLASKFSINCPACEARRKAKAESQKKWRAGRKSK